MVKLINIFKIIIFANFSFKLPKKNKIVLWDDNLKEFLEVYVKKDKFTILYSRGENYNILILLKTLLKNGPFFSGIDYFNTFLSYVEPKLLITFTDNYEIFYKIGNFKNIKKIFIQNAYRSETKEDVFFKQKQLKKQKKNLKVDYMLTFNEKIGKKYSEFVEGQYKVIGSFRSNRFKILKRKKIDILFISHWRAHSNYMVTPTLSFNKWLSLHSSLVKKVQNFAKSQNLNLVVYGKYKDDREKNFFKNILGPEKNWSFLDNNRLRSYHYCDMSKLIVSSVSTLGYEAISRSSKVAIFNIFNRDNSSKSKNFCWPYKIRKEGPFWTSDLSESSCNKLLKKLLILDLKSWEKIKKKNFGQVLSYNKNNTKFTKLLKKLIKD
jgi:surface carbohydrate biosynthesis protein